MKVVIDTNVLVSGLLSSSGPPSEIVGLIFRGRLTSCYDMRILSEYESVLRRSCFRIRTDEMEALLLQIRAAGCPVLTEPLTQRLPDPADQPFLEVALSAGARCLITGNLRHFPSGKRQGVAVVSPAEFIELYRRQ